MEQSGAAQKTQRPPINDDAQDDPVRVLQDENGVYEMESLCMNCLKNGETRILPIKIPYFKQVLLESFSCEHCGFKNSTVKSAGEIQEKGTKYLFRLDTVDDFERQVVRSDTGVFRVEDLDLETPTTQGQLTNLESLLSKILTDLESDQPQRQKDNPEVYAAIDRIVQKLTKMLNGTSFPITVTLDDISGNSFIEPSPTDKDSKYVRTDYTRTHEQNIALGLVASDTEDDTGDQADGGNMSDVDIVDNQLYEFQDHCPACAKPCSIKMKKVHIPHFKEVIIMATDCENCGYRSSDVKTGGAIPELGRRITLHVKDLEDMSRDILKSETCALKSPELDLEVQPGTLGGRFTTVEGLLVQVRDQLHGQIFDTDAEPGDQSLTGGDSMNDTTKSTWQQFFAKLDRALKAEFPFSIVLEDPLASSFVQSRVDDDPQLVFEEYERTEVEKEDLGLNDMVTEGYEEG